ncbi:hypothetical protein HYT02_01420 [Candidatus Gottesmanbacteria bacterium]|nr:hypothetical protein [Candidatus Gottesmanbacteria bacterium]
MEWGNLVFVGLVVTQAFADEFKLVIAVLGVIALIGAYLVSFLIMKGGGI